MKDTELLQMALGLMLPGQVSTAEFNPDEKRLDIRIDFSTGSTFTCPKCGLSGVKAYDTVEKTWRHLDFFQHQAFLTARTPRINCTQCGVRLVTVPWARQGSGFTLLFEGFAMALAMHLPIAVAAERFLKITDRLVSTNAGAIPVSQIELLTDPRQLSPSVRSTATVQGKTYEIREVRPTLVRGVNLVDRSILEERDDG